MPKKSVSGPNQTNFLFSKSLTFQEWLQMVDCYFYAIIIKERAEMDSKQ